jgi:2,5-dihydroxypyridine 5,6-dioxygenase
MNEVSVLIEEMLKLSKVTQGERIALISTHDYDRDELEAYRTALSNLGAEHVWVVLPPQAKGSQLVNPASALFLDLLKQTNMGVFAWSSCADPFVNPFPTRHTKGIGRLLLSGFRGLLVELPLATVRRMWPTDALIQRTLAGARLMEQAEMIRVKSDSGTDLVLSKKGRPAHTQYGVADVPGRWDNFGFGCVACAPLEENANGTLTIAPPSAISALQGHVTEPLKLTLRDGYIVDIEGGLTAQLFRRWLAQWNDPEAYGVSHIGWGTHPNAGTGHGGLLNLIAYLHNAYGSILIAFGDNDSPHSAPYSGIDGKRTSVAHCDIGIFDVDFYLDDRLICSKGMIVDPECR